MKILYSLVLLSILSTISFCSKSAPNQKPKELRNILTEKYANEKKVNKSGSNQAKIYSNQALKLHKQKKFKQALNKWIQAFSYYACGNMYYDLGNTLFNLKQYTEAISAYGLGVQLKYNKPHLAYYNSACAYSKLKDEISSLQCLIQAIKKGYTAFNYIKKDPDLKYLRTNVNLKALLIAYTGNLNTVNKLNYADKTYLIGWWIYDNPLPQHFPAYLFKKNAYVKHIKSGYISEQGEKYACTITKHGYYKHTTNTLFIKYQDQKQYKQRFSRYSKTGTTSYNYLNEEIRFYILKRSKNKLILFSAKDKKLIRLIKTKKPFFVN